MFRALQIEELADIACDRSRGDELGATDLLDVRGREIGAPLGRTDDRAAQPAAGSRESRILVVRVIGRLVGTSRARAVEE